MKSYTNGTNNIINTMMGNNNVNNNNNNMNHNVMTNGNNINSYNTTNNNNSNNSSNTLIKDYYDRLSSQTGRGITLATIQQHQMLTRQRNGTMMSHDSSNRSFLSGNDAIQNSQLSPNIKSLIYRLFVTDNELDKSCIEEPSIRLLEEISEEEQQEAISEFVDRYKKAKHKIKKSKPGYFRGVCQKYWKQNREKKKRELLKRATQNSHYKYSSGLSPLVAETIESLFTTASGLETSIIDDSVEKRLTQLNDQQAIEALHEFCSAVMYRQDRIRNMNAYLMNIIKRHVQKEGNRGQQLMLKSNSTDKNATNVNNNDYNKNGTTNTSTNNNNVYQIQSITNNINIQTSLTPSQMLLQQQQQQQQQQQHQHQHHIPNSLSHNLPYSYNASNTPVLMGGRGDQNTDLYNPNYQMYLQQQHHHQPQHFYQHPHLVHPQQQPQRHTDNVSPYIPTFCPTQLPQITNQSVAYSSYMNNKIVANNNENNNNHNDNENHNNVTLQPLSYNFNYVSSIPNAAINNTTLYPSNLISVTPSQQHPQSSLHVQPSPLPPPRQQTTPQPLFYEYSSNLLNDVGPSSVSLTGLSMPAVGRTPSFSLSNIALSPLASDIFTGALTNTKDGQFTQEQNRLLANMHLANNANTQYPNQLNQAINNMGDKNKNQNQIITNSKDVNNQQNRRVKGQEEEKRRDEIQTNTGTEIGNNIKGEEHLDEIENENEKEGIKKKEEQDDNDVNDNNTELYSINENNCNGLNTQSYFAGVLKSDTKNMRIRKSSKKPHYFFTPQLQTIDSSGFHKPTFDNEDESNHNQSNTFVKNLNPNSNDSNVNSSNNSSNNNSDNSKGNSNNSSNYNKNADTDDTNNKNHNQKFGKTLDKEQGQEITKKLEKLGSFEDEMIYLSDVSDHEEDNNHTNDDNNHTNDDNNHDNDSNDNNDNNNDIDKNNNNNAKKTGNISTKKKDNNENLTVNEIANEGINAEGGKQKEKQEELIKQQVAIQAFLQTRSKSETDLLSSIRKSASAEKKDIYNVVNNDKNYSDKNLNATDHDSKTVAKSTSHRLTTLNEVPVLHDKYHTFPLLPLHTSYNNNNDNVVNDDVNITNNTSLKYQHSYTASSSSSSSLSSLSHLPLPIMTDSHSIPIRLNNHNYNHHHHNNNDNDNDNENDNVISSHIPTLHQSYSYSYYSNRDNTQNPNTNDRTHHRAQSQYSFDTNNHNKQPELLTFKQQRSYDYFDYEHNNQLKRSTHGDNNNDLTLSSIALAPNKTQKIEKQNQKIINNNATDTKANVIANEAKQNNTNINANNNDNEKHGTIAQTTQQNDKQNRTENSNDNNNIKKNHNNNNINDSINNVNQPNNQLNVNFPFPTTAISNPNWQQLQQMFPSGMQFNSQSNIGLLENGNSIPQDLLLAGLGTNNNTTNNGNLGPLSNATTPIFTPTNHNLHPMTPPSTSLGLAQTPQLANNSNWTFVNINGRIVPIPKTQNNTNNYNVTYNTHNNDNNNPYFNRNNNMISITHQYQFQHQHLEFNNDNNHSNNIPPMFTAQTAVPIPMPTNMQQPSINTTYNNNNNNNNINNQMLYHPSNYYFYDYNTNVGTTTATTATSGTTADATQR